MQRRSLLTAACHSTLLSGAGLSLTTHAQTIGDTIVLGQSAPFSGPAEQLGIRFHQGAKLWFDHINANGGVHGRRIELKHLDDGYEPDRCVVNTKQFLNEGAFALFGYIGTPTSMAALPLATEAKTPFFAPFTGAQALREPFNRHVFHIRASYFDETAAIVRLLTTAGTKKIAVFYQNDAYGKTGLEGVVRALKAQNLEPLVTATVERNSTDVSNALATIMTQKPEAVVQIGTYKACAEFIRQARHKWGYSGNFYNVSFVGTQALIEELGSDAKGVSISQVVPFPYTPITPLSGEYLQALKSKEGIKPNYSGMEGYIAAKVLVEGLSRAGKNLNKEGFIQALEGIKNWNLGGFFITFGPDKHTASAFVDMTLLTPDGRVRR